MIRSQHVAPGLYGLQRISEYQPISGTWTPSFYQYDGGGSVRQLTNTAGAVTDRYEYDAFGNEFTVSGSSSTPNNYLYRGEKFDSDLGLYYLRARYYNPTTGRLMSRDPNDPGPFDPNGAPTDPKKWHKYLYAGGDPVNRLDPTGRDDTFETPGVLADKLNFYNNANFNNRGGQCQAYVYRGLGLLLDPRYLYSPAEEELDSVCDKD